MRLGTARLEGSGNTLEPGGARIHARGQWPAIFAEAANADEAAVQTASDKLAADTMEPLRPASTVLVIADADLGHRSLRDGLASLGHRHITVHHPLEAIVRLQDDSLAIDVVLAPAHDPRFRALELLGFMREEFPLVRRVAYTRHALEPADATRAALLDIVVLTYPAPLQGLAEALQASPRADPAATQPPVSLKGDVRSDQELFDAWRGSDRRAYDELDRRYRPRIRQLATSMSFSDEDADEIVQETLLGLFLRRKPFLGDRTPDHFITGLATARMSARLRGGRRRTRLLSALTRAAVTDRAGRERGGQPDERMLGIELASRAATAVENLPGWCRRPFWLRAVQGQSARDAGATLDMLPSTVDMWLLHARRLIANRLQLHLT